MSHITTHILDTTRGKPAQGVTIILYQQQDGWTEMAKGQTNKDGRITDWVKEEAALPPGLYKMKFETKTYFDQQQAATFYPFVEITFEVTSGEHYHIPLLLSPFGYSTYRGS